MNKNIIKNLLLCLSISILTFQDNTLATETEKISITESADLNSIEFKNFKEPQKTIFQKNLALLNKEIPPNKDLIETLVNINAASPEKVGTISIFINKRPVKITLKTLKKISFNPLKINSDSSVQTIVESPGIGFIYKCNLDDNSNIQVYFTYKSGPSVPDNVYNFKI